MFLVWRKAGGGGLEFSINQCENSTDLGNNNSQETSAIFRRRRKNQSNSEFFTYDDMSGKFEAILSKTRFFQSVFFIFYSYLKKKHRHKKKSTHRREGVVGCPIIVGGMVMVSQSDTRDCCFRQKEGKTETCSFCFWFVFVLFC